MKRIFGVLLVLVLAMGLCTTSWAAEDTYLDAAGTVQDIPADAATLTSTVMEWSGWYVVEGNVEITGTITLSGETHLILKDECELRINGGIKIVNNNGYSYKLHIYGQSGGTGKLSITGGFEFRTGTGNYAGIHGYNSVYVNGGVVDIALAVPAANWCIGMNVNNVIVNGGSLTCTVSGGNTTEICAGLCGALSIKAGSVTSTAGTGTDTSAGVYDSVVMTGGTLVASGSGQNGKGTKSSVTPPSGAYWWRTDANGEYDTQETWTANALTGTYAEVTTVDPNPAPPQQEKHYYYAPTEAEETIEAPQTFDAGVAVYGVMAAMSVLGMGVVKKKAF